MTEAGQTQRPILAAALAVSGLGVAFAAAAALSPRRPFDSGFLLLFACSLVAAAAYVRFEETFLTDSSLVPYMLVAAFWGAPAVVVVAVASEAITWLGWRYRPIAALVNAAATAAPLAIAAGCLGLVADRDGLAFYLAFAGAGMLELTLNACVVMGLISLVDGRRLGDTSRNWRALLAPSLFNVFLAVAAVSIYSHLGLVAVAAVLAVVLAFRYLIAHLFAARRQAAEIAELAENRARLLEETLQTEERERRRLSEALHDGPLQHLLMAGQDLDEIGSLSEPLDRVRSSISRAVQDIRRVLVDLHPPTLDRGGLHAAIARTAEQQARRAGFAVQVHVDSEAVGMQDRLVFSVIRELLINTARHAKANDVAVRVELEGRNLVLSVADDGRGFEPLSAELALAQGHVGLISVRERLTAAGGELTINTRLGRGTLASATIPAQPEPARATGYLASVGEN